MSITSAEGIQLAQRFGVSRVVLARELSLHEIRTIRSQTDCELELFVHGALCVSYSGQCFSSEAWGGRSANRGQCAQACRLPYELLVDEVVQPLGAARYLLSPGDLYALRQIPEIIQLGISALKIEGRYKDENYVALTTRAYRQAVDEAWTGLPLQITQQEELQLEQVYSRGLGAHFISGTNHQTVVDGRAPRHRGVLMGSVNQVRGESVIIAPSSSASVAPLKAGDGVVFDAADWRSPQVAEEGGHIYQVLPRANGQGASHLELRFGNGEIDFTRIRPGDLLWRTHDPDLEKVARPFTEAHRPVQKQPLQVRVLAHEGEPLVIEWTLASDSDISVTVRSSQHLGTAQQRPLTSEYLREQLGRLGNTPYSLGKIDLQVQGNPFAPSSLLNDLRRQAVDQLQQLQGQPFARIVYDPQAMLAAALAILNGNQMSANNPGISEDSGIGTGVPLISAQYNSQEKPKAGSIHSLPTPQLHLLVRTPEQLAAALAVQPASITLDYLDLYGLRPAVEQVQAAGITARVASPRVLKPDEQRIVNFLLRLECQIVVRSSGLLAALQSTEHQPLIGDFSLNAANALSATTFLQLGLLRLTPTYDLNAAQIAALAQQIGGEQLEVVAYQHLPVFHTEHCVFCRFLSQGTSYKDCGHPCEKHRVALRDEHGRAHPVMADVGCRNTVFGAEAQEASRHLAAWQQVGIQHYRLEFVHESGEQVTRVTQAFAETLNGHRPPHELTHQLQRLAPQGTTEGSLFIPLQFTG